MKCLINKLKSILQYGIDYSESNRVNADYYNGSENDLENIFLELVHLSEKPINVFNRTSYSDRLRFLAEEGIHILEVKNIKPKSFKVSKEEADAVILNLAKKTKKVARAKATKNLKKAVKSYKKNVNSSVDLY
jgi:hypothetical protein